MASSGVVSVTIQSDSSEFPTEKRFDPNIKVSELKKKLELITGATHTSMKLTLSVDDKEVGLMSNDDETFAHYLGDQLKKDSSVKLLVKDEQPSLILQGGEAPKFVISEDKYLQRPNNARNFIKEMREKRLSGQSTDSSQ
uniref:Tubulin-folding cofactor B n=1 Tax=Aceria tosichella TaxID=561515 RepID=A0A6G1S591_9ACAR